MTRPSFFAELKRRNVYKVGAVYAVAGWLLVQVVTQVLPVFEVSSLAQRIIVLVIVAGFPVALALSWIYELTPQGIVKTDEVEAGTSTTRQTGQQLNRAIIGVLLVAVLVLLARLFWPHAAPAAAVASGPTAAVAANDKSIAVLPFENLSADPDNAYFASGIQDEILTRLAKIGALKVISRTSTQQYAAKPGNLSEIAKQLGVANILEGSVQKIGNAVHINVQLIRAAGDEHLWAESYNRKLDDVFAVEGEVAQAVAETLRAKLSGAEAQLLMARPTANPAAYDAYLRGLAFEGRVDALGPNILNSVAAYEKAVQLDPGFALAWAHLSRQHSFAYINVEHTQSHRDAAHSALEAAKKLSPDLAETQLADGYYHYWVERDYEGAKIRFEAVRKLIPSNPWPTYALAAIARRQGQWPLSRRLFDQSVDLDPGNVFLLADAAGTDISMRDAASALKRVEHALELSPGNPGVISAQATAFLLTGELTQAQALLDPLKPEEGDSNLVSAITTQAILTRRYEPAIAILETQLEKPQALGPSLGTYESWLADLQRHAGDVAAAAAHYRRALAASETALRDAPDTAGLVDLKAWAEAGLGMQAAALADERRAIALLPASMDALVGPTYAENLARIQARFGDKDSAIAALQHLLGISYGSPPVTPALLRLDPDWDNLRDDPRFQKLIADGETPTR